MPKEVIKKEPKNGLSLQGFDMKAYKQSEAYVQAVDALYNQAVQEFAVVAGTVNLKADKPFAFADYPQSKVKAQQIVSGLATKMKAVIVKGNQDQWLYACKKNDAFLNHIMNTSSLPKNLLATYQDKNLDALDAFQNRKVGGLGLSDRVWNYAGQMKTQMELGIDIALGEGKSAASLSRDLRQYLQDPDKLFHKVKDKHGMLHISKNAAAFHPGQGKYRSSYKNAMRLTRSEINMAYRVSDQLRWQNLDFVVGFEVKLSNNHTTLINGVPTPFTDICDDLAGKYPKSFMFKGWHPQCRCHVVPIMKSDQEMNDQQFENLRAAWKGDNRKQFQSKNQVNDVPDNFKNWIADNMEKSQNWKSAPYFVKENFVGGTLTGGLKVATIEPMKVVQPKIVQPAAPIPVPKPTISKNMPDDLKVGSAYLNGKNVEFSSEFFDLLDPAKPVTLVIAKKGGSYFLPGLKRIHIEDAGRTKASDWERECVVYHEYGHAIDDQRGLRYTPELQSLMKKYGSEFKKVVEHKGFARDWDTDLRTYKYKRVKANMSKIGSICDRMDAVRNKIVRMNESTFTKRGITKADVTEQLCSTSDAIKAINNNYGYGHTTAYFKRPGMKETEFLAHCFENAFAGNTVFKKYLPDLYEDMIKYVKSLE